MNVSSLVNQTVIKVKNDNSGHETIADLRRQARAENAKSRAKSLLDPSYTPVFVQVALFGRLGKNNPNSWIYRQRNAGWRNGYQRIDVKHSSEIAVYINPMSKDQYGYRQTSTFKFVK
jgi:hypothetical protein